MKNIDFNKKQKVYFIGIGGISMSALALILKNQGFDVSGSDNVESELVKDLEKKGIKVNIGQKSDNIEDDIELVVYTAAIHKDNPELSTAISKGITCIPRSKLLGDIMLNYKTIYNIAGTHGKTTITSIISKCLLEKGMEPTVTVGGILKDIGSNLYIGNDDIFVAEACEYTNSFLDFHPNIEVISNIEEDHLDFFKDINDIRKSFKRFIDIMDEEGLLLINKKIDNIEELVKDYKGKLKTYGTEEGADYQGKNIKVNDDNTLSFDLYIDGKLKDSINMKLHGRHNVENALAAISALLEKGLDIDAIKKTFKTFEGAERRIEDKGTFHGIKFIDDYAHHPSEIKASLSAILEMNAKNLYIVFQPHTYSRTKALFEKFAEALKDAPNLIITDIYAARENNIYNISSRDLINEINSKYSKFARYIPSFKETEEYLKSVLKPGDILVTMGAGDIYKLGDALIKHYSGK